MVVLVTLLALAVGLLALLVAGLLRSHAEILRSLRDLGVDLDPDRRALTAPVSRVRRPDAAVTEIVGRDPSGGPIQLALAGARYTLLAFLTASCVTCKGFWETFSDHRLSVPLDARVIAVTRGEEAESPSSVRALASPLVHTVMSSEAWRDFKVPGAPYFVLVDGATRAVIGEGTATTWERVHALMEQAIADSRERPSIDADLHRAGIEPGDPSLYPESER